MTTIPASLTATASTTSTTDSSTPLAPGKDIYSKISVAVPSPTTIKLYKEQLTSRFGMQPICSNVPLWVWRWVWIIHRRFWIPLLHHRYIDSTRARDSAQALTILWCKAMASLDPQSPTHAMDNFWTYDMLPPGSRRILKRIMPWKLFPRLHHANIELRTLYLEQAIQNITASLPPHTNVRLVSLGAGYDTRSLRLLSTGVIQEAVDVDLEPVKNAKARMIQRLVERRRTQRGAKDNATEILAPLLISVDLNNLTQVDHMLQKVMMPSSQVTSSWHTIFLTEGVFIFLQPGIPDEILKLCATWTTRANKTTASFCFVDQIQGVNQDDEVAAHRILEEQAGGWILQDWAFKPGKAKHMGVATLDQRRQISMI